MNYYAPIPRRDWPGTHPNLGSLLGFIVLAVGVPYGLEYGLVGFGGVLLLAGLLGGLAARGGARMGVGVGARAVGGFMLLLLVDWTILLLDDAGFIALSSSPEMAEFVPYMILLENLWVQVGVVMQPVVDLLLALVGGDQFLDLLLRVGLPTLPGAVGGALAGAAVGRPAPQPLPMAVQRPPRPYPDLYYGPGNPGPQERGFLCPWCGLKVLPHMVKCWNCGGPLRLPPPPTD